MPEIQQGQVYWAELGEPVGSRPDYRRPVVVIQGNRFNRSAIATVVVCVCTTNLRLAAAPGNVLLEPPEGGVPKPTVVNVSAIATINKFELVELLGNLNSARLTQILKGVSLVLE